MTSGSANRFGRIPEFDERSKNYQIRSLLTVEQLNRPRSYTWACDTYLDQGWEGACVGFGIAHEVAARPKPIPMDFAKARAIYKRAQQLDPWPGEAYEGTSVLAGMKAAVEFGYFQEYRWAGAGSGNSLEDLIVAVGYRGPAVLGTNWYSGMVESDSTDFIHVTGDVVGGHCYLLRGVACRWPANIPVDWRRFANLDLDKSYGKIRNSWGSQHSTSDCFITFRDLQRLLWEAGEACIPVIRTIPE